MITAVHTLVYADDPDAARALRAGHVVTPAALTGGAVAPG
jgi:hypothetical protein